MMYSTYSIIKYVQLSENIIIKTLSFCFKLLTYG